MKGAKGEVTPSQHSGLGNASINWVTHGYRSLAPKNAGEYPFLSAPCDPGLSSVLRASRDPGLSSVLFVSREPSERLVCQVQPHCRGGLHLA
jgi:hypothetical protein